VGYCRLSDKCKYGICARAGEGQGRLMRRTTRRSLQRVRRALTWPLSGHIVFALATGLVCGIAAAHYPDVISPPYAAIIGALAVYPLMVAMWWRLNRPGGNDR
jgi:hypothetical protein